MKSKYLLTTYLCVAIAALFNLQCSNKDEGSNACALTNCLNGGICSNGNCNCPAWYEGSKCEKEFRTQFLGVYAGTFTAQNSSGTIFNQENVTFSASANGVDHIAVNIGSIEIRLLNTDNGSFTGQGTTSSISGLTITAITGQFSGNCVSIQIGGTSSAAPYEPRIFRFDGCR